MNDTSALPHPPLDADGWFDSYFDGERIRYAEGFRSGIDRRAVRLLAAGSIRGLLEGRYLPERPVPIDLDAAWHVVRVQVSDGAAGIGGGPLNAGAERLVSVRSLAAAALAHLTE